MKFLTFNTGGQYKEQAEALRASAEKFGIEFIVIDRPDHGTWWQNCNQKCEVILDALKTYGDEPVIWNDSDTRYRSYPKLFETLDYDYAAYYMDPQVSIGGTMFFNGKRALRYVEAWVKNVRENPTLEDDSINLRRAIQRVSYPSIFHLPPAYCWNELTMRATFPHTLPVIEHEYFGERDYPVMEAKD
jgi:hypothetical protein